MIKHTPLLSAVVLLSMILFSGNAYANYYADCNQAKDDTLRLFGCVQVISAEGETPFNIGTAYARLCTLWARKKDLVLAKLHCEAANSLLAQPENYLNLGSAEYENGFVKESIAHFATALQLNPRMSTAFYNRAVAEERLGETEKALADYKAAALFGDETAANEVTRLAPVTAAIVPKP